MQRQGRVTNAAYLPFVAHSVTAGPVFLYNLVRTLELSLGSTTPIVGPSIDSFGGDLVRKTERYSTPLPT